jgi:hypothetical protein
MKKRLERKYIFLFLTISTLALFACNLGAQGSSNNAQQATQPAAPTTSVPQAAPTTAATKSGRGTPAEAQAMLQLAIQHYQAVGRDQALKDFTNRAAPFFNRDLYVACINSHLVQSANGGFPNLVGSSVQPISRARWDAAVIGKVDSINYSYIDPATGVNSPKTLYYEKAGTEDVCGVGAYQQ